MATQATLADNLGGTTRPVARPADYKTVAVNGCDLAYVERGSGDAVIFVHGGISDLRTWSKQMSAFSEKHRAIAYSRRYAWPNPDVPDGVDDQMWPHVEDLIAVISALGAAPAHLVGNSWGGFICLLVALHHPDLVRSITVEEPPVLPLLVSNQPGPRELAKLLLTHPRSGTALMKFFSTIVGPAVKAFKKGDLEAGARIFACGVDGADFFNRAPHDVHEQQLANVKTLRASLTGAGFPAFTAADARRIKTPALLLTGESSPAVLRHLTDRLDELLPNTHRVHIRGAPHIMHYAKPSEVNSAVLQFIAAH